MEEPIEYPLNIKIKQEKLSPPPESPKKTEESEPDEKKNVEPLKTSNQLLEELFSVFNAAPPENLLNDELLISSLLKEKKKKSKKSKKKSKKRSRSKSSIDEENGDSSSEKKSKKRKKHKKSSKCSSDAENNNSENELKKKTKKIKKEKKLKEVLVKLEESIKKLEVPEVSVEELTKTNETPVEPKPSDKSSTKSGKIVIKSLKNSTVIEESVKLAKEKEIKKSQNKCDGELTDSKSSIDYVSDISLSDEETYQKQKKVKDKQNGKGFYDSYDRDYKSSHKSSRHRDRSRSKDRDDHYSRYKDHRHRDYDKDHLRRHRSRSRSPRRRSTDRHKIDKKRLLEIARKNAIQMLKSGALPGTQHLAPDIKEKALEKMRYGGKTIEELTDYCRKLSKGESLGDLSSVSDEEDSDHDKDGKSRAFNHPFMVKERLPIVMNIRNAVPIAPKTAEQTKAILLQFPVSSGQQHRLGESEWVPVPPKKPEPPPKKVVTKTVATIPASKAKPTATNFWQEYPVPQLEFTIPDVPSLDTATTATTPVFPDSLDSGKLDVSSIITKRLNAMRKLQDNPEDFEAKKLMFNTQKDMSAWATSKFTPGQFTGSTGANILTVKELASGFQSWAKKDQFTSTTPLSSGMGMHLLQKMGWKPGEGLGKDKTGSLQPLLLEVKLDKKGLVATEENPQNKKKKLNSQPRKTLEAKHPVSLLGELAAKRKWGSPDYQVVTETGPGHQKNFLFKVTMNGMCYQPSVVSNNKKEAKANAAKCCLQQMGVLPS